MTNVAERKAEKEFVEVLCAGIACEIGFTLAPDGYEQSYASFKPGIPLKLEKHYADFLIAQDAHKFTIVKAKKEPAVEKTAQQIEEEKAAAKAAKKAAKAAKK